MVVIWARLGAVFLRTGISDFLVRVSKMVHVSKRAHYCLKGKGKREIWREDPHPWLRIFGSSVLFRIPYFNYLILDFLILEILQNSAIVE